MFKNLGHDPLFCKNTDHSVKRWKTNHLASPPTDWTNNSKRPFNVKTVWVQTKHRPVSTGGLNKLCVEPKSTHQPIGMCQSCSLFMLTCPLTRNTNGTFIELSYGMKSDTFQALWQPEGEGVHFRPLCEFTEGRIEITQPTPYIFLSISFLSNLLSHKFTI